DNEWWRTAKPAHLLADHWRAVRTSDHLLATDTRGEPFLLFDLRADPHAVTNLVDQPLAGESRAALLTTLRTEAQSLGDAALLASMTAPVDGASPSEKGGMRTVRE
ncbi:MAG: hypothetical protein H0W06_07930, partial [Chloroflexia bacterium]|nr:hypothetical protein [Chloroflexia bacterium]